MTDVTYYEWERDQEAEGRRKYSQCQGLLQFQEAKHKYKELSQYSNETRGLKILACCKRGL
jgi:hypothetical protein